MTTRPLGRSTLPLTNDLITPPGGLVALPGLDHLEVLVPHVLCGHQPAEHLVFGEQDPCRYQLFLLDAGPATTRTAGRSTIA